MSRWVIERQENGQKNTKREAGQFSPLTGNHRFADADVREGTVYIYDFLAVGSKQSIEGNTVHMRFVTRGFLVDAESDMVDPLY
jgi:hypothetical protein